MTVLRTADMRGHDIAVLLAQRALHAAPRRPLLIANSEIGTHGSAATPEPSPPNGPTET